MNAKKLPSGHWRVRVEVGRDENGKRIWKSFTSPSKKKARRFVSHFRVTHASKMSPIPPIYRGSPRYESIKKPWKINVCWNSKVFHIIGATGFEPSLTVKKAACYRLFHGSVSHFRVTWHKKRGAVAPPFRIACPIPATARRAIHTRPLCVLGRNCPCRPAHSSCCAASCPQHSPWVRPMPLTLNVGVG